MVNVGMVFGIVITIIVIGFVLTMGMGQITEFFCIGSNSQAAKAVKDVESISGEVYLLGKGSSKTHKLSIPSDIKICFVNTEDPSPHPYMDNDLTWNPSKIVLENILLNPNSENYKSNVWIYFCGDPIGEGYKISYVSPSKSFCVSSGRELYIENKASFVDISIIE